MDDCFNKYIPESTPEKIIIKPIGKTFINGLAFAYSEVFPSQLKNIIDEKVYKQCIVDVNEVIASYWPCSLAFFMGYGCSICTCGLSFFFPYICISDAERIVKSQLDHQNMSIFGAKGLQISLMKKCSTSWLEIKIIDTNKSREIEISETSNSEVVNGKEKLIEK